MQYRATPAGSRDSPLALVLSVLQTTSRRSDPTPEPQIARNVIRTTSKRKGLIPEPLIARTVILTTGARGNDSGANAVMEMAVPTITRLSELAALVPAVLRPLLVAFTRGQGPKVSSEEAFPR